MSRLFGLTMLFVCVLVMATALHAADRVAVAVPAKTAPTIDGKLNDACWKDAAVMGDFLLDSGRGIAPDETTVRILFDKDNLYLGVTCSESDWDTVAARIDQHDGPLYSDDDLEIFFDTNRDRRTFMQFTLNTLGTKGEALFGKAKRNTEDTEDTPQKGSGNADAEN